jgi:tetratricopeptide (TPR) repeat protein
MHRCAVILFLVTGMILISEAGASTPISFGEVHFQNSCLPSVQGDFELGVALLHSFEFGEADKAFRKVERVDPGCVIAAWGMALANTQRSGADIAAGKLASGLKELEPWLKRPAKTEREQMYLAAVSQMYIGYEHTSSDVRWQRYIAAMSEVRERYPDDVNASLFYALALVWTAGPGAPGLEQRQTALSILLPIFAAHPDNPGAAHYIIHAADTPELATIALPAARKYAEIAPDSPHALHMPSHIFNRLGYWQESVASNIASARVADDWVKSGRDGLGDEFHALNNLEYGYLQLGEDEKARDVLARIGKLATWPGGDAWLPIDGRIYFDVETHDWQDALKIEPPPASPFEANFDVYWIHSIAAARLSDASQAAAELDKFHRSSDEWIKGHGWGEILHIALLQAQAWTLYAQGKRALGIKTMHEAVQFERDHPIYYADVLPRPSAEMLGDMLDDAGRASEALAAYQEALAMAPNRLDSLRGARQAAARSGRQSLAKHYAEMIPAL